MSAHENEIKWFQTVYQPGAKQLTLRAVLMGGALGSVMSMVNLFVGLKTGWALGVAITACILSFAIWKSLRATKLAKTDMTILENNCMQSTASSAGYSTGGTLVSAIAAWMMLNNSTMSTGLLMGWMFFLAVLGVVLAIPMKRQMINIEQLPFPSGTAAAETLRSLHESGQEGVDKAASLGLGTGLGVIITVLRDILGWIPGKFQIFGATAAKFTVSFEPSALMIAAGAIIGLRTGISLLLGATLCWGILVPVMYNHGIIEGLEYKEMVQWSLWGGVACMVTSSLLTFAWQWRTILRALSGLTKIFGHQGRSSEEDQMAAIEVPNSWFAAGSLVGTIGVVTIAKYAFNIPIWMGVLGVIMAFFLALVACRATGETDITPVGAMGKITQLFYGTITPRHLGPVQMQNVNLMSACITAGVAGSSADLLTDLKSGYLLGANPRKQFLAQFSGIFFGTVCSVLGFKLIIPSPEALGTDKFPAPAAQTWKAVAELLSNGIHSLDSTIQWAILIGAVMGIILVIMEKVVPQKGRKFVPSPMGLGMAFTFHFMYSFSIFLGALLAYGFKKWRPLLNEKYTVPVASGLIAGESMAGIAVALAIAFGWIG